MLLLLVLLLVLSQSGFLVAQSGFLLAQSGFLVAQSVAHFELEHVCGLGGFKQSLYFNSNPAFFTFKARNREKFSCHLELHLPNKQMGFYVFIERLLIESSPGCSKDFLQFGRDDFIFTSFLSEKYCKKMDSPKEILDERNNLLGYDFKNTSVGGREYIEVNDDEMDVWIEIAPALGTASKEVKVIVVPFEKSCNKDDDIYRHCPSNSVSCFRRELFCDKIVKCDVMTMKEQSTLCHQKRVFSWFLSLPVLIIIYVLGIIVTIFVLSGIIKICFSIYQKRQNRGIGRTADEFQISGTYSNSELEISGTYSNSELETSGTHSN